MPRRVPDYSLQFVDFNQFVSIGGFIFGLSQVFFLFVLYRTFTKGTPVDAKVWEAADGLEWTVPSPAPYHTFDHPPLLDEGVYSA